MDINGIIELSPLHLSFPTFFLSLNLITNNYVLNWLIIPILISIYSIAISFLCSTASGKPDYLMKLRWCSGLLALIYANHILQNLNVVNLVLINLLINDFNMFNERSNKEFKSALGWVLKRQPFLIWAAYVVYDYIMLQDWYRVVGYILLLLPLHFFLYDIKDFQKRMDARLSFQESVVLLGVSSILLYIAKDTETNFNMLIISIGSMLILLISQFNKSQLNTSFFNKYLFIQNFRINIILIDIVYILVTYVSMQSISYQDILFNLLILILIKPSTNDCFNFELESSQVAELKEQSLIVQLFSSKETKSISRFLLLNTSFMFVQLLYSFRSKSLSLLSDSLHMLLDCTSLFLGLLANLLSSKQSDKFPFGLFKVENLAGFTNGCLLISIVGSIFIESTTRIFKPVDIEKTTELLVVSFLGLIVNLVGIFLFNHGHDHGHSHGHSHSSDSSEKKQQHNKHSHSHEHEHSHSKIEHLHDEEPQQQEQQKQQLNDNMHGIFLHILADTLGSVGVIVSTVLIKFFNVQILDPLTSMFIGILILISSIPLLKSSVKNLLLSLTADKTLFLKNQFFQDLLLINGLKTYSTPRFWPTKDGKLTGYIHIIFFRNCHNTTLLRENVNKLLHQHKAQFDKVYIQYENEIDSCWCRP